MLILFLSMFSKNNDMTGTDLRSSNRWDNGITGQVIQQEMMNLTILMIFSGHFSVWMVCKCIATEGVIERRNILHKISFTYHNGAAPGHQANAQRNQGIGFHYLFILIFLFYAISPLFKSAPYHSFNLDSQYRFKVNSDILHTQYYVREEFFDEVKKDPAFKRQVDLEVDEQYLVNLKKTCEQATRLKTTYEYKAYQYRPGEYRDYYLNESKKVDLSSCQKINSLRSRNG